MNELVSIITPCYNSAKYIEDTIRSVINQTYPNWEMILVDDCSVDNSINLINKYSERDHRIKLFKLEMNSGHPSIPRNYGIKMAEGRFIAFLDSDDLWHQDKLKKQIEFMITNTIEFSYSAYEFIAEDGTELGNYVVPKNQLSYYDLLKSCQIGCLTAIYDTKNIGKLYFKTDNLIKGKEDYCYWLDILKLVNTAKGMHTSLAYYRLREGSISSNKVAMARRTWNVYYRIERLGLLKSMYYFTYFIYFWIKRRIY
jgi:glycosyltransferase involved in cell wall biosynthesis